MKTTNAIVALLAGLCMLAVVPAHAASDEDLAAIRQQLDDLRKDYDTRIEALEKRLEAAEEEARAARAVAQAVAAAPPQPAAPAPSAPRPPAPLNAQNPGISVVLNGNYVATSREPEGARIPGFVLDEEAGLPDRGFSLGESELTLAANIDPFLYGSITAAVTNEDEVEVEEAYLETTSLGGGFTVKGGRFFSGIGYLNERHAHTWTFVDAPLPYRAFLGNQFGDDGVQIRWLAPADLFLEFGAEWFRGDSFPAGNAPLSGMGTAAAYVHSGGDFNASSSWLAALSYLRAQADDRDTGGDLFTGHDDLGVASFVYKWAPGGNFKLRNLALSGEVFYGREVGRFNGVPVSYDRFGWYAQGVYQFRPRWSFGLRYAGLGTDADDPALAGSTLDDLGHSPQALSALIEFDTTEFGRFRLQYTRDMADLLTNDEVFFQYTIIYGPHKAHRY